MPLPIKDFIAQKIREFDSKIDVSDGSVIGHVLIRVLSYILQPISDEVDNVIIGQSVQSIQELDNPDAFDEDAVDALVSNLFVSRKEGSKSSGTVRIYYYTPQEVSVEPYIYSFLSSKGFRFFNTDTIAMSANEMAVNRSGNFYYIDVAVEAENEGLEFNLDTGDITTFEFKPSVVASVTNVSAFSGTGTARETNTDLINRVKDSVSVRDLVIGKGAITTLLEEFETLTEIQPVGFADPEMMRDIKDNAHVGGYADIYVKTAEVKTNSIDVLGLQYDSTREISGTSALVISDQDVDYSIGVGSISEIVSVTSIDYMYSYIENYDYTIDAANGTIKKIAGTRIYQLNTSVEFTSDNEIISDNFIGELIRKQHVITIPYGPNAGEYNVREHTGNSITIFGTFTVGAIPGNLYTCQIDDRILATFKYNPISVDIKRIASRVGHTITDVPLIRITSIDELDIVSQTFSRTLDGVSGFGDGGFGEGSYGMSGGSEWELHTSEPHKRYSANEDVFISFSGGMLGRYVRIYYEYANELQGVQDFIDNGLNQVMAADLLAKHFIPVVIDMSINYNVLSSNVSVISNEDMVDLLKDFINKIVHTESLLEISDIIDLLYDNGAVKVELPIEVTASIHLQDGSQAVLTDSNVLELPEVDIPSDTDVPFSSRIGHLIAGDITLNRSSV